MELIANIGALTIRGRVLDGRLIYLGEDAKFIIDLGEDGDACITFGSVVPPDEREKLFNRIILALSVAGTIKAQRGDWPEWCRCSPCGRSMLFALPEQDLLYEEIAQLDLTDVPPEDDIGAGI